MPYQCALTPALGRGVLITGSTSLKNSIFSGLRVVGLVGAVRPVHSAPQWQPDQPKYESGITKDIIIQMDDALAPGSSIFRYSIYIFGINDRSQFGDT